MGEYQQHNTIVQDNKINLLFQFAGSDYYKKSEFFVFIIFAIIVW